MNLKKELRKVGFDLINGPIRNHKPLQLWLKKMSNSVELYYEHLSHALLQDSNISIEPVEDKALSVTYDSQQEYKFNIGITVLEELLTSLGFGNLGLSTKIETGKKITLSYNSSLTQVVPSGNISDFLSTADFRHPNRGFLRNANRDNILIISGVLMARDLKATIETDFEISPKLEAELSKLVSGEIDFSIIGKKKLQMISEGNSYFPIAVKANRIDWDNGEFKKMTLVTDNRFFF